MVLHFVSSCVKIVLLVSSYGGSLAFEGIALNNGAFTLAETALGCLEVVGSNAVTEFDGNMTVCASLHASA